MWVKPAIEPLERAEKAWGSRRELPFSLLVDARRLCLDGLGLGTRS